MNNETKSIAYAFVANGIQIYFGEEDDQFIISRLVCADCGGPWYMNLTECFLCGAINEFLYKCSDCGNFVSITNSSRSCSCGSDKLYLVCPNKDCISNKDEELLKEINKYGGVFNKKSGFLISQQYCLYCGSQYHVYKTYRIKVITTSLDVLSPNGKYLNSFTMENNSYVVVRQKKGDRILYGVYKTSEFDGKSIDLKELYNNFTKVVEFLYPIKKQNDIN